MFVALGIQHAMRMPRIILSPLALPTVLPYFSTFSRKRHDFLGGGKVIEHEMYVLNFSRNLSKAFSHSKENLAGYRECTRAVPKVMSNNFL